MQGYALAAIPRGNDTKTAMARDPRARRLGWLLLLGGLSLGLVLGAAHARSWPVDRFFGAYTGQSDVVIDGETSPRDLSVTIRPHGKGFIVTWAATKRKADGRIKQHEYSIAFEPTHRENIYASMMRPDLFGHMVPLNPLRGDPFVWATVSETTLTVYAILITDTGAQDVQIYRRTLASHGLALEFIRLHDTSPIRRLTAHLTRIPD